MKRLAALSLCVALLFSLPVLATISVTTARIVYTGSGSTGPFPVPFHFTADSELTVTKISATSLATVSVLTLDVDYTVTGAGTTSGYVTLISTLSSAHKLVIQRGSDYLQSTDYEEGEAFTAATHEAALDKHTRELQEIKDASDRSLKLLPGTTDTTINVHLANPAASKAICWDSTGKALTNCSTTTISVASLDMVANYADFAAMVAAVGSTPTTMLVTEATAPDENSTVPCTLKLFFVNGAALNPTSGVKIILCSPDNIIAQPDQEIFGGNGTIVFQQPGIIYSDWWGPAKDGTDAYADLNASIESAPATSTVIIGKGVHTLETGLSVRDGINIRGNCSSNVEDGTYSSTLKSGAGATGSLLTYWPANPYPGQTEIECLTLDGNDVGSDGLEIKRAVNVKVRNVVAYDFTARGFYVNGYLDGSDYGSFMGLSFDNCWSGKNAKGFAIERNGTGVWGPVSFRDCYTYYNSVGVFVKGQNSTSEHYGTVFSWDGGSVEGLGGGAWDVGFRLKDGVNAQISNTYIETYATDPHHFWLSGNSFASVRGGNVSAVYWNSKYEDNSTLCMDSPGANAGYFNNLYGGQRYVGFLTNRMCVGGRISDKKEYGSPNFPKTDSVGQVGNPNTYKGMRFTDGYGTEYIQVEDNGTYETDGAVGGQNARWGVHNGRAIIPFDYNTLNAGNVVIFQSETDFLLTNIYIVVTTAFTHNDNDAVCDGTDENNGVSVGTTSYRNKYIGKQVDYGASYQLLGQDNATITALDNNDSSTGQGVLRWSSTRRPGYLMIGRAVVDMATNSYEYLYDRSYIGLYPCPNNLTTPQWTAGEGYVVIEGHNFEYQNPK